MENITQGQWFRGPSADLGDPIDQSLRFRNGTQQQLVGTSTIPVDDTYTLSFWYKNTHETSAYRGMLFRDPVGSGYLSFNAENGGTYSGLEIFNGSAYVLYPPNGHGSFRQLRDPSAWFHCVITQVNSTSFTIYINGEQAFTSSSQFDWTNFTVGSTNTTHYSCDGYIADLHHVDGTALTPTSFGRYNKDGVWVPKTYSGTYGTNGFHLTFDSSQTNGIGHDSSGNNKHFTASNFDTAAISSSNPDNDIDFFDTPTSNYATLNPLDGFPLNDSTRIKATNLEHNSTYWGAAYHNKVNRPILPGDKLYIEIYIIRRQTSPNILYPHFSFTQVGTYTTRSQYADGTGYFSGVDAWPTGSVIRLKLNGDNRTIQIAVDNGSFTSDLDLNFTGPFTVQMTNTDAACQYNFGQMPFIYSVPTGYTAMSTDNLPEPTIKNGKKHFEAVTYTGNGSTQSITGLEFQPDLVWIKVRDQGYNHQLWDSVRGTTKLLIPNGALSEYTFTDGVTSFNSDGFSLGSRAASNNNTDDFVAWCWKAGGTAVSNTDGTITSSVSANTDAGFSIVTYTSPNSSSDQTVGHGLTVKPEFIIVKNRDTTYSYDIYHGSLGYNASLLFTNAATRSGTFSGEPDASVFRTKTSFTHNGTDNYVAYCWHSVEGFSKFGSYTGNGSIDGAFVYLGFRPAFLMVKRTNSTGHWMMIDTTRSLFNPADNRLHADLADSEFTNNGPDILSNGFKMRNGTTIGNMNNGSYIYAAFAENPFGGENVPPATAR